LFDCLYSIVKQNGVFGLYRGLWPSILGVVPYVGVDFAVYDTLKRKIPKRPDGTTGQFNTLACGATAGTVGQTVAYPLDLIRRRLQVQAFSNIPNENMHYQGTWDAFRKILKHEGVIGLYRGTWPNYLKVVPSISVSFLIFENLKNILHIESTLK